MGAIEQIVVFEVNQQQYALDISNISEIIRMPEVTSVPNTEHYCRGIINLRGSVVPVMSLNLRMGDFGYGYIQNKDMSTIAHPNNEYTGNSRIYNTANEGLRNILQRMSAGETGYGVYHFEGEERLTAYAPLEMTHWTVAQAATMDEVLQPLGVIRNVNVAVTVVAVVIMTLISIFIANFITTPLVRMSRTAEAVANGDLTQKVDVGRNSKDEIGTLAASFEKMIENLKSMVNDISYNSERVASHSQELASSSEEVSATAEEVASTTSEVAATSSQGAENAEIASRESEQVQLLAEEGNRAVQETVEKINSIAIASENASWRYSN